MNALNDEVDNGFLFSPLPYFAQSKLRYHSHMARVETGGNCLYLTTAAAPCCGTEILVFLTPCVNYLAKSISAGQHFLSLQDTCLILHQIPFSRGCPASESCLSPSWILLEMCAVIAVTSSIFSCIS